MQIEVPMRLVHKYFANISSSNRNILESLTIVVKKSSLPNCFLQVIDTGVRFHRQTATILKVRTANVCVIDCFCSCSIQPCHIAAKETSAQH